MLELEKEFRKLKRELDYFVDKHDSLSFKNEVEAAKWLQSMPIETLMESIKYDNGNQTKLSLKDVKRKAEFRGKYTEIKGKIDSLLSEFDIEKIESLQKEIEDVCKSKP